MILCQNPEIFPDAFLFSKKISHFSNVFFLKNLFLQAVYIIVANTLFMPECMLKIFIIWGRTGASYCCARRNFLEMHPCKNARSPPPMARNARLKFY